MGEEKVIDQNKQVGGGVMKRFRGAVLIVFISALVWVQVGVAGEIKGDIKLFNGPPQGTWRPMAVTIQQNIQNQIPALRVSIEPGGGASNVIAANDQRVLSMATTSSSYDGYLGSAPYQKKMENIRQVMVLWSMLHVIMTTTQTGITSIEQCKGKRVNVQQRGYASELINQMILSEYNLTYKDIIP